MIDKYQLRQQLQNGIVTVVFEKVDGTLREMKCTLQDSFIPEPQLLTEDTPIGEAMAVWSVDDNGWRSFRVANVKEVK